MDANRNLEPILEVRGLSKTFALPRGLVQAALRREREVIRAVDGVAFTVARGETLGSVGESGCGKTTLLRCIARLYQPEKGEILFEGQELLKMESFHGRQCPGCDSPRRFCLGTQTDIQCPGNLRSDDIVRGLAQAVNANGVAGRINDNAFFLDPSKFSDLSRNRVIDLLNGTGTALRNLGHPVDINAGIKAAQQVLGIS